MVENKSETAFKFVNDATHFKHKKYLYDKLLYIVLHWNNVNKAYLATFVMFLQFKGLSVIRECHMLVFRVEVASITAGMFLFSSRPIAFQNALRYRALDMLYK